MNDIDEKRKKADAEIVATRILAWMGEHRHAPTMNETILYCGVEDSEAGQRIVREAYEVLLRAGLVERDERDICSHCAAGVPDEASRCHRCHRSFEDGEAWITKSSWYRTVREAPAPGPIHAAETLSPPTDGPRSRPGLRDLLAHALERPGLEPEHVHVILSRVTALAALTSAEMVDAELSAPAMPTVLRFADRKDDRVASWRDFLAAWLIRTGSRFPFACRRCAGHVRGPHRMGCVMANYVTVTIPLDPQE
jgi:DNA-binding transcriptional ArsR family regulator